MIRTNVVNLTVLPAVAYRQKLPSGGSGIVILRGDVKQPGIASISKTSGEAIPTANTQAKYYPPEAFREAIELTSGLPYRKQGTVRYTKAKVTEEKAEPAPEQKEEEVLVDGYEYKAVVATYTDKNGKLSYDLLNRDLIKFAHSSSKVRSMLAEREPIDAVRLYIVGTKFRNITGNRQLTDAQVLKMAELLDEVYPRGVFRELNDTLRLKAKGKK